MSIRDDFEAMLKEFAEFRGVVGQIKETNQDAGLAHLLDELLPELDKTFANVKTTLPQSLAEIEADLADCEKRNEATLKGLDELDRKLAEGPAAPKPRVKPDASLPAGYGQKLRAEILARFGEAATVAAEVVGDSDGSVWKDDHMSTWEAETQGEPPPKPPATGTPKPSFDPGESVRELDEAPPSPKRAEGSVSDSDFADEPAKKKTARRTMRKKKE